MFTISRAGQFLLCFLSSFTLTPYVETHDCLTESVDWCQCCQQGVALDDAGCFHISFSFSAADKAPLCKGGWQKSLISDWGIVLYRYLTIPPSRLCRATSLCTREALVPTIILQITLLVSVKARRLYRRIYFLILLCYDK